MTLGSILDELIPAFMQLRHHAIVHKRIKIIVTILCTYNRTYFDLHNFSHNMICHKYRAGDKSIQIIALNYIVCNI